MQPPEKPAAPPTTPPSKPETGTKPPEPGAQPPEAPKPGEPPPEKRASPWKLVDQFKQRALKLEQELAQLRERALPEDQWKAHQERLTAAEKRAQQYEEELRFTNFQKSEEFRTKYQEPYEKAWKAAMGELADVTIEDPANGQARRFSAEDMLHLLNLSLPEARRAADELYGPLADDVMAHRKTIRELFDQQTTALDDARKNGAERDKKRQEQFQAQFGQVANFTREAFEAANKAILEHPEHGKWLKPIEGDTEGNAALEKGMAFAKSAFMANPLAPGLNPQQRADAARRHAALINRAAAYSRLTKTVKKLESENAQLKKDLEGFQASQPGNGSPTSNPGAAPAPRSVRDEVFGELRKLARPA